MTPFVRFPLFDSNPEMKEEKKPRRGSNGALVDYNENSDES